MRRLSLMLPKLQIVKGFAGTEVQIVRSGGLLKIDLKNATNQQLRQLHKLNHPAVEEVKPPPKKDPKKSK